MPYDASFDATQFQPFQGGGGHPKGKFPAYISNTSIRPTKSGEGQMFEVEFVTQAGSIVNRYNLWNKEPKAVEIAHKELSALCYATGIFKLDFRNDGATLHNARLMIEVDDQKNKDGTPNGYVEIKKVYDMNGNEPGRAQQPAPAPAPQQPAAPASVTFPPGSLQQPRVDQQFAAPVAPQGSLPMQQSPQGGWGQPAPAQASQAAPGGPVSWGQTVPSVTNSGQPLPPANEVPPWAK